MKEIEIKYKQEFFSMFVDDVDYEYVTSFNWHMDFETRKNSKYFSVRRTKRKNDDPSLPQQIKIHQEIFRRKMGRNPKEGFVIDHWDCDTLNNTRKNLREITRHENAGNLKKHKTLLH